MHSNKSWIEISKSALLHNFGQFQKLVGNETQVLCVVKANAYGYGLKEVIQLLNNANWIAWYGVDNLNEAMIVNDADPKASVLILGYTMNDNLQIAVEHGISITIYSKEQLEKIVETKLKKVAHVHLKVETGLNRQGLHLSELLDLVKFMQKNKGRLVLEGLSTHFANIEDTFDPGFAMQQLKNFQNAVDAMKKLGENPPFIHCAASAATLLYPETHFSMVRIGKALYGAWPSRETQIKSQIPMYNDQWEQRRIPKQVRDDVANTMNKIDLIPVLTWKSIVAQVKEIQKGESVGYGRTWVAKRKTKIAVIPVGYSDGYDRGYSNNSRVIILGAYAPVIGRIAMNMFVIDVTDIKNLNVEDEVILVGRVGDKEISVDELAQRIGTINYEIEARVNPLLPRFVVK